MLLPEQNADEQRDATLSGREMRRLLNYSFQLNESDTE